MRWMALGLMATGCDAAGLFVDELAPGRDGDVAVAAGPDDCWVYEVEGNNDCDGPQVLELVVDDVWDEDGDGRWSAGETLTASVQLVGAVTLNYPHVLSFHDGDDGTPMLQGYVVSPRFDPLGGELTFTAPYANDREEPAWPVVAVGSACSLDEACPHPSPVLLAL